MVPSIAATAVKRKRAIAVTDNDNNANAALSRGAPHRKRARHTETPDLLSPLSDELLIRILTYLPLSDLLNIAPLSKRFHQLSTDSQVWKLLYYTRFVLPRVLRIPGFRDGSVRKGNLHRSSRRAVWADGRNGGWVDMHTTTTMGHRGDDTGWSRNWKRQYKLRHNWSKGKCAVEELNIRNRGEHIFQLGEQHDRASGAPLGRKVLVKVSEGVAVTADLATGLRAWDLKTKILLVQTSLDYSGSAASPTCLAIDDQNLLSSSLDIAIGFADGSFGVWRFNVEQRIIIRLYRHEKSSNGELIGITFSRPYLLTATKSVLVSLYTFDVPASPESGQSVKSRPKAPIASELDIDTEEESGTHTECESDNTDAGLKADSKPSIMLPAPYLLTSLKSHTSRAPLALSIRKSAGSTVASIAYTFSTLQGWSLGIQDLHIQYPTKSSRTELSSLKETPEITSTRLAYTLPVRTPPLGDQMDSSHSTETPPSRRARIHNGAASSDTDKLGPTSICYTHPYLLATLPDNTLILHLCTSTTSTLSIGPGIRLWGHTSGISDAEITSRGKAVSVSSRGEEIRVWELEGRGKGKSIEVRPTAKRGVRAKTLGNANKEGEFIDVAETLIGAHHWDERRNWVGFDDEMVIVLKESEDGRESLLVYDFT